MRNLNLISVQSWTYLIISCLPYKQSSAEQFSPSIKLLLFYLFLLLTLHSVLFRQRKQLFVNIMLFIINQPTIRCKAHLCAVMFVIVMSSIPVER